MDQSAIQRIAVDERSAPRRGHRFLALFHDADHAARELTAWISWARRSRLHLFKRLGATSRQHFAGLSNGFVEAMNGLIQAAKARARGYRTDCKLITICYLLCAKLKHLPTNPWIPSRVTGVQASN